MFLISLNYFFWSILHYFIYSFVLEFIVTKKKKVINLDISLLFGTMLPHVILYEIH